MDVFECVAVEPMRQVVMLWGKKGAIEIPLHQVPTVVETLLQAVAGDVDTGELCPANPLNQCKSCTYEELYKLPIEDRTT
jgi:hypothetical protein